VFFSNAQKLLHKIEDGNITTVNAMLMVANDMIGSDDLILKSEIFAKFLALTFGPYNIVPNMRVVIVNFHFFMTLFFQLLAYSY
jgi:hypothetical protein